MANIDPSHSQVGNYGSSSIYGLSKIEEMGIPGLVIGTAGLAVGCSVLVVLEQMFMISIPVLLGALIGTGPVGGIIIGVTALVAVMLAASFVVGAGVLVGRASRKHKVQELVERDFNQESVKDKLAQHLRSWAEEGEIKNLKTLLEYESIDPQKKEQIVEIFLNRQGEDGKSTMDLLVQQQIPDFLYLLAEDQFDKANHIHSEIVQWGIDTDVNGAISLKGEEFFTHLAMVNYDLAKACLNHALVDSALFNHTVFEKINDSDTREAFINAVDQGTYQLPQVELIVQRYR